MVYNNVMVTYLVRVLLTATVIQFSVEKLSKEVMSISKEIWPPLWLPAFCPFTYTAAV
jgi:hypothetical protein